MLTYLECKECVKYLGVLIDYKLSWKNHIDSIALKISKTIGLLSKLRYFVPHKTLVNIYNSLVTPYLHYGLTVWGQASKTHLRWLNRVMQDHEARASDLNRKLIFSFFLLFS